MINDNNEIILCYTFGNTGTDRLCYQHGLPPYPPYRNCLPHKPRDSDGGASGACQEGIQSTLPAGSWTQK